MALPSAPSSVITGAGSGFGRALALELAARGSHLVLSDVNLPACEETARMARDRGAASVTAHACDVTRSDDLHALEKACERPVDLLVNNAGVSSGGLIGDLPLHDWRWTIEVDLFGVIHGCHAFVPRLKQQGHGHVLNVASAAGLLSAPRMAAYNAAKAGVIAVSETLAAELEGTSVGVTVLCPTFFDTDIVRSGRFADDATKKMADRLMKTARPVEEVVKYALESCERGELYSVPMADARLFWRLKRAVPGSYRRVFGLGMRMLEKYGSGKKG